jgi:hypothetical protein
MGTNEDSYRLSNDEIKLNVVDEGDIVLNEEEE